jgi:hypothetical protein
MQLEIFVVEVSRFTGDPVHSTRYGYTSGRTGTQVLRFIKNLKDFKTCILQTAARYATVKRCTWVLHVPSST